MPKTLICDLDDTLIVTYPYYEQCIETAVTLIHTRYGLDLERTKALVREINVSGGHVTPGLPWSERLRAAFSAIGLAVSTLVHGYPDRSFASQLEDVAASVREAPFELRPGAMEILYRYEDAGWNIIIFTKGHPADQAGKAHRHGIHKFARIEAIDAPKTVDRWADLFRRHGLSPQDVVVLGDSLREDIAPAIALGARAYWVTPAEHTLTQYMASVDTRPTAVLGSLRELFEHEPLEPVSTHGAVA